MAEISLSGWNLFHTWHEPHGNGSHQFYQEAINDKPDWWRMDPQRASGRIACLVVYRDRSGAPNGIATEQAGYALAAWARASMAAKPADWQQEGARTIEPCCTAGAEIWVYQDTHRVHFFSAAGHGEQATYLGYTS